MKLYYYSILRKEFSPLFPRTTNAEELREINRYRNTTGGFWNPIAWIADGAAWVASSVGGVITDVAQMAAIALLNVLAQAIFWVAGKFLQATGFLLDMAIGSTISSNTYDGLEVIKVGWSTVRDFSNMFFIFALLYIAIKTILGMGGSSTKKWVANLIIAALLINFSLFATKVVIDAGNVLAMGFWGKMEMGKVAGDSSAAQHLMQGLKIQSILDVKDKNGNVIKVEPLNQVIIYLGGAVVMFIAGYVFLAGAIMMIMRTVTLLFLMIVSPFAFLSFALPVGGGFGQSWLKRLIGNTFAAPAFLAMLYLVIVIINGLDLQSLAGANGAKWGAALDGDPSSFIIIYNYILIIMLLLASLTVANEVSSGAGSAAGSWAKKGMGMAAGYAAAGGGATLRQTAGRYGKNKMQDKDWVKEQNRLVAEGTWTQRKMANAKLAGAQATSKGSFDIRNTPMSKGLSAVGVNAGAGSKRNYETHGQVGSSVTGAYRGTEKEKELIDKAKSRYGMNPEAQKAFLTSTGVELDQKRNKDVKKELDRGISIAKEKETVKNQPELIRTAQSERDALLEKAKNGDEAATVSLVAAEEKLTQEKQKLIDSIKKLSGKEFEETVTPDMLKKGHKEYRPEIMEAMGRTALMHVNSNPDIFDEETRNNISNAAMTNGPEESRQYLITQAKLNTGHMPVRLGEQLGNRSASYAKEMADLNKLPESEWKRKAIIERKEAHEGAVQDILGGMKPKDVAKLTDSAVGFDDTIAGNYTKKHLEEIAKYHEQIKQDHNDPETKRKLNELRVKVAGGKIPVKDSAGNVMKNADGTDQETEYKGTTAGKAYMKTEEGARVFGGQTAKADIAKKEKALADAKLATKAAKEKLDAFPPDGSMEGQSAVDKAHQAAQAAETKAQAELASAKKTKTTTESSGGDEDPDNADEPV